MATSPDVGDVSGFCKSSGEAGAEICGRSDPSDRSSVRVERIGDIALLTLDRPDTLNAISRALIEDLSRALDEAVAQRPRVRCVVLTGAGRAFCAGGDISVHRDRPADTEPYDLGDTLHALFNPLLLKLVRLPVPFVNAVNGPAAGAGCPLALCADIVIAGQSASFQCGFARIGLVPDLGATWLLPRLIGRARAHAMMMLDERVSAEDAARWGMVNEVVADGSLVQRALEVANRLARGSLPAIVATRKATLIAAGGTLGEALDYEAELQRGLSLSADFAEGIRAFFDRRQPDFKDA